MKADAAIRRLFVLVLMVLIPGTATAQVVELAARRSSSNQPLLAKPARLQVEDAELAAALTELSQRSGVPLAYSPTLLPAGVRVDCMCQL